MDCAFCEMMKSKKKSKCCSLFLYFAVTLLYLCVIYSSLQFCSFLVYFEIISSCVMSHFRFPPFPVFLLLPDMFHMLSNSPGLPCVYSLPALFVNSSVQSPESVSMSLCPISPCFVSGFYYLCYSQFVLCLAFKHQHVNVNDLKVLLHILFLKVKSRDILKQNMNNRYNRSFYH